MHDKPMVERVVNENRIMSVKFSFEKSSSKTTNIADPNSMYNTSNTMMSICGTTTRTNWKFKHWIDLSKILIKTIWITNYKRLQN